MAHLQDNLAVLERALDAETAAELDAINGPGNAISDFHNSNDWMKARVHG
jgi:1-deoxyxylulose-5-phosphate synthase